MIALPSLTYRVREYNLTKSFIIENLKGKPPLNDFLKHEQQKFKFLKLSELA